MTSDAIILVLEDERAQILTLRAQLKGLGRLAEFSVPESALEYARLHPCDAAIVDVRMPRARMDGLAFLRALREFDRDLAIIIRTASDADDIADQAIELRAIKRAVKSRTSLLELRQSVQEAIQETRQRREASRDARSAAATRTELAAALGTYDLRLAAADLHRGLIQGLRNQLTALSALATLLERDAALSRRAEGIEHARRSAALTARMVDSVNAFLDGPFGDGGAGSHASVNECVGALRQFFRGASHWADEGKRVTLRRLPSDTFVAGAPLELMNGLRHLLEFCLARAAGDAEVTLTAAVVFGPAALAARLDGAGDVLNREALRGDRPLVSFRVTAPLPDVGFEAVRDACAAGGPNPRTGNLAVLAGALTAAGGGLLVGRAAGGALAIEPLFPVFS